MSYALVMFGATVEDDSLLLTDGTWMTFPRLLSHKKPNRVSVWLFRTEDAAHRVRKSWHRPDLGVVAVQPSPQQGGLFSVTPSATLPPPGGFARKAGEPEGRCPYCSHQPTNRDDFCSTHRKELAP